MIILPSFQGHQAANSMKGECESDDLDQCSLREQAQEFYWLNAWHNDLRPCPSIVVLPCRWLHTVVVRVKDHHGVSQCPEEQRQLVLMHSQKGHLTHKESFTKLSSLKCCVQGSQLVLFLSKDLSFGSVDYDQIE